MAEIRPFQVDVPDEMLDDLRRRIGETRWPTKELVADRSQGVQLAAMQELARYWTTEYDWRRCEARLNALPQFKTEIDGLNIHFIHVKSAHENALPLIMTHGWPGSIIELLETIGPLTDPTAHGGRAEDAFHLVLPSIPGYGFSDEPTELGWGPIRIGQAWHELMRRLGYTRYVAQGGDVGSQVTDAMGRLALDGLIGIHTNLLTPALGDAEALSASPPTKEERAALDQLDAFHATGTGYFVEQATRPETIGYALLDSPIALAAWMIDHDTDSYEKIARAFVDEATLGQSHPRTHRRQHHAVLADRHRGLGGALVLGGRTRERSCGRPGSHAGLDSGRLHLVPRGDLADPAQLGRAGIPQRPHLLQRGGQGRSLRRLGGTGALRERASRRVPPAAIVQEEDGARAPTGRREASLRSAHFGHGVIRPSREVTLAWRSHPSAHMPNDVSRTAATAAGSPATSTWATACRPKRYSSSSPGGPTSRAVGSPRRARTRSFVPAHASSSPTPRRRRARIHGAQATLRHRAASRSATSLRGPRPFARRTSS